MDCLLVKDYYNKAVQPYFCSPFKKIPHQLKPPAVAVSDIHLNDQERTLTSNKRWESVQKKCLNQCFAYKHYLYVVCGLEEQPLLLFKATFFFLKKLSGFFLFFWFLAFFSGGQWDYFPPIPMYWYSITVLVSVKGSRIA